jgi:hypothetical protein
VIGAPLVAARTVCADEDNDREAMTIPTANRRQNDVEQCRLPRR